MMLGMFCKLFQQRNEKSNIGGVQAFKQFSLASKSIDGAWFITMPINLQSPFILYRQCLEMSAFFLIKERANQQGIEVLEEFSAGNSWWCMCTSQECLVTINLLQQLQLMLYRLSLKMGS
jgi:hypothetical protein